MNPTTYICITESQPTPEDALHFMCAHTGSLMTDSAISSCITLHPHTKWLYVLFMVNIMVINENLCVSEALGVNTEAD